MSTQLSPWCDCGAFVPDSYEGTDDCGNCGGTRRPDFPDGHAALESWFELSYAQFLTVPRLVLRSMPDEWQGRLAALMEEMDDTFDWRPKAGKYWVRLRDDRGRFASPPLWNYRYGSVEDLRLGEPAPTPEPAP